MTERPAQNPADLPRERSLEWIEVTPQQRLQQHWPLLLTYGILTFLLGVALAVWPGETVKVVAFLLAFQLVVTGCMRLFLALADVSVHGGARLLSALAGAVAIIVGLLFLMEPLQTLGWLVVLGGSLLILVGFADLAEALVSTSSRRRVWDVVGGVLSVCAGGFLVVSPERSLELLVWVACAWLLCYGFVIMASAFFLRSRKREADDASQPMPQ